MRNENGARGSVARSSMNARHSGSFVEKKCILFFSVILACKLFTYIRYVSKGIVSILQVHVCVPIKLRKSLKNV